MPPRKKQKIEASLDVSHPPPAEDDRLPSLRASLVSATRLHDADLHDAVQIHEPLLRWYDGVSEDRAMPWRKDAELDGDQAAKTQRGYEVWLSEIMCQQTQASRVVPYFNRWIDKFPTLESLANGSLDDVRELWQGLGYYSRASRLLEGAKMVVNELDGRIPERAAELGALQLLSSLTHTVKLPGVGPYTAGAIASIAFGEAVAAIDGNVERVLSRCFALYGPAAAKTTKTAIADLAAELIPSDRPGDFNQALMDLGFSICQPQNPKCPSCPLVDKCLAYAELRATEHSESVAEPVDIEACHICVPMDSADLAQPGPLRYPMRKVRKAPKEEAVAVLVLDSADRVLLVQRPEKGLLAGQWEFVAVDLTTNANAAKREKMLTVRLAEIIGKSKLELSDRTEEPEVVHRFTHILCTYIPESARLGSAPTPVKGSRARWVDRDELAKLPLGKAQRLIWDAHLTGEKRSTAIKKQRKVTKVAELELDDEEEVIEAAAEESEASESDETSDEDAPVPPRVYTPRKNGRKIYVEDRHSEEDRRSAADSDFALDSD